MMNVSKCIAEQQLQALLIRQREKITENRKLDLTSF